MTGAELQRIMGELNISPDDVAQLSDYTRGYVWRLTKTGDELLPEDTAARIRTALLHYGRRATEAFMALAGGEQT